MKTALPFPWLPMPARYLSRFAGNKSGLDRLLRRGLR